MKNVFYRFDFDEVNIHDQIKKFKEFLLSSKNEKINLTFIRNFPPCIVPIKKSKLNYILLSNKDKVVTCNLYFGKEFFDMNKSFSNSPFISQRCKNKCLYFNKGICRGLFNKKFLNEKKDIEDKIGKDKYHAVQSDYENGMFVFGSICKSNCKFCVDKNTPNYVLRHLPFLTKKEVIHFLHYSPIKIAYAVSTYHCASGDFLDSPYLLEIINFLPFFISKSFFIATNGNNINKNLLSKIKGKNLKFSISLNSTDPILRSKLMGYSKKIDILQNIKLLDKYNIPYNLSVIPFKSTLKSGDFFNTIKDIITLTNTPFIRVQKWGASKWMEKEIINDLKIDYNSVKNLLLKKFSNTNFLFVDDMNPKIDINFKIINLLDRISKIFSYEDNCLILSPQTTYKQLSHLSSKNISVKSIKSLYFYDQSVAGTLTVKDYISAVIGIDLSNQTLIIPSATFDNNFDDITLTNINNLYNSIKVRGIYLL